MLKHIRIEYGERKLGTDEVIGKIAHVITTKLQSTQWDNGALLQNIDPKTILPFASNPHGQVLPARGEIFQRIFPEYTPPSKERVDELSIFASAKENYGTAPGPCAAFLEALVKALQPRTAFTFGTARGDIEALIAESDQNVEIVTCDISNEEIESNSSGTPDENNLRYRKQIGIESDFDIGKNFKFNPRISSRIHQIMCDSFVLNPHELSGTMDLVFIDGCHQLPNALMDLASALQMANRDTGCVIVLDDFRKGSPLNAGVESALVIFSQVTGLPILTPCPPPQVKSDSEPPYELKADVGVILVPAGFETEKCNKHISTLRDMAIQLKSCELQVRDH